jgi:uncharacterized RDD family membrane protein YckC
MHNSQLTAEQPESHLFSEQEFINYEIASVGQRLLNYIVDSLLMRFTTNIAFTYLLFESGVFSSVIEGDVFEDTSSYQWLLLSTYMLNIFNYLFYYTICEKAFNGKTLGKMISGTKVIRDDGAPLTWKDAILRSLSRVVPFEPFSVFASDRRMWHDSWTKTTVVKSR